MATLQRSNLHRSSSSSSAILERPSDKELEVAHIFVELPNMIFQESQRARLNKRSRFQYRGPPNWCVKRRRWPIPTIPSAATASFFTPCLSCKNGERPGHCEETLTLSQLPSSCPLPPLPPPRKAENHLSMNHSHGEGASKSLKKSLSSSLNESSNANLSLSEQNPAKKTKREELSETLSLVSQQKHVLAKGMEDVMTFYEQVKAYKLKLDEKEREVKQMLKLEEKDPLAFPVIYDSVPLPTDQVACHAVVFDLNLPPL